MIEITIRVKPACAARLAALLRNCASTEPDRGQAKAYRGAARRLEHATRPVRYMPRTPRPAHREIDEEAVQRVVLGLRPLPQLSRTEARLACLQLTRRQCPALEIADRVQVAPRTVQRWRAEDQKQVTP